MQIKATAWDMDGTLIDSMEGWMTVGERYLKSRKIEPLGVPEDSLMHQTFEGIAAHFRKTYGFCDSEKAIIDGIRAQMAEFYRTEAVVRTGAATYLKRLRDAGVRVCIVTATDRELAVPALETAGLLPYVERIFTCREVGAAKTRSKIFDEARDFMGATTAQTCVFEDAYYAVRTAKAAGYRVCGIYDRFETLTARVKELSDCYVLSYEELSHRTRINEAKLLEIQAES